MHEDRTLLGKQIAQTGVIDYLLVTADCVSHPFVLHIDFTLHKLFVLCLWGLEQFRLPPPCFVDSQSKNAIGVGLPPCEFRAPSAVSIPKPPSLWLR